MNLETRALMWRNHDDITFPTFSFFFVQFFFLASRQPSISVLDICLVDLLVLPQGKYLRSMYICNYVFIGCFRNWKHWLGYFNADALKSSHKDRSFIISGW